MSIVEQCKETHHTCEGSHDHLARSASEHDDARAKVLCDKFLITPKEKVRFPILALPFLYKHLQTHLRFGPGGCGIADYRYVGGDGIYNFIRTKLCT